MSVYQNIVPISHYWPGITPHNVWDLPYDMWLLYLRSYKEMRDEMKRREAESG